MKKRVLMGAGFAGLELATSLSEAHGDAIAVTVLDKSDAFVFGYAKLDVMFGKAPLPSVRLPYRAFNKPGVTLRREAVTAIDPATRKT